MGLSVKTPAHRIWQVRHREARDPLDVADGASKRDGGAPRCSRWSGREAVNPLDVADGMSRTDGIAPYVANGASEKCEPRWMLPEERAEQSLIRYGTEMEQMARRN
jgi:hypothetical protein